MISKKSILEALKYIIMFETQPKMLKMTEYFALIGRVTGSKNLFCTSCFAATKQTHNSFTMLIFREMQNYPEMLIDMPEMKGKYTKPYFVSAIPVMSFELLKNNINTLNTEIGQLIKRKLPTEDSLHNLEAIKRYYHEKLNYFVTIELQNHIKEIEQEQLAISLAAESSLKEGDPVKQRNRLIDREQLLQMKEDGETNVACAKFFGVSKQAIGKYLKSIKNEKV